jgi:hypothetical protein
VRVGLCNNVGVPTDPTRFGYTPGQWQSAVDAGVDILKGVARDQTTISYQGLCDRIKDMTGVEIVLGEFALPHFLGDMSKVTLESSNIAITTLVTYKGTAEAGPGLYQLAELEGLLPKNSSEAEKERFRVDQMRLAYDEWKRVRRRPGERFSK